MLQQSECWNDQHQYQIAGECYAIANIVIVQLTGLPIDKCHHAVLRISAWCCRFIRDDAAVAEAVRQRKAEAAAERQRIATSIRDSLAKQVCCPLHMSVHQATLLHKHYHITLCHTSHTQSCIRLCFCTSPMAMSSDIFCPVS